MYFLHSLAAIIGVFELVMVPWLLISLIGLALVYPKRGAYDQAEARWEKSWICTACGDKFVPEPAR